MLFIALLPFQGWASASMLLSPGHQGHVSVQLVTPGDPTAGNHPCHALVEEAPSPLAQDDQANDHGACQSCNICHGMAMALTFDRVGVRKVEQQYASGSPSRFSSNDTRRDRKPPIL